MKRKDIKNGYTYYVAESNPIELIKFIMRPGISIIKPQNIFESLIKAKLCTIKRLDKEYKERLNKIKRIK